MKQPRKSFISGRELASNFWGTRIIKVAKAPLPFAGRVSIYFESETSTRATPTAPNILSQTNKPEARRQRLVGAPVRGQVGTQDIGSFGYSKRSSLRHILKPKGSSSTLFSWFSSAADGEEVLVQELEAGSQNGHPRDGGVGTLASQTEKLSGVAEHGAPDDTSKVISGGIVALIFLNK